MRTIPDIPTDRLTIVCQSDELIDRLGHDPRSRYVERYWLGVLGPSTTWLLRHIADELETSPSGFVMNIAETAQALGVSGTGKNSPFIRALGRLIQFELAQPCDTTTLAVRKRVPSLSRRHVLRLPTVLQERHDFWQRQQLNQAS